MAATAEVIRARKRDHMRRVRSDPVRRAALNEARRNNPRYTAKGREYSARLRDQHFLRWRARNWGHGVTAKMLAALWKRQRGICALSGRKLDRTAHLDHISPKSFGGVHTIENLRWLDPWVNTARGNLSDQEFMDRCNQVAEWIGRRIVESCTCPTPNGS